MSDQPESPELIATQIEELDREATDGPWEVRVHMVWAGIGDEAVLTPCFSVDISDSACQEDHDLIEAYRGLAPLMAAEWRKSQARIKELETQLLIEAEFGDPLTAAREYIEELLSGFDCRTCHDKGWVVGVEGASTAYGMGGSSECQVDCPDCKPRILVGEIVEPS